MKNEKLNLKKISLIPSPLSSAVPDRVACGSCGLYRYCKTPFMYPYVPDDWDGTLLLIGEGPGEDEDENSGRPFTGKAGKLLRQLYRKAGYNESSVALVNAVRCRAGNNDKPSMAQIRACRPFLLKTIQSLNPKYVLGLGGIALRAITNNGDANITKARGKKFSIPGLEKPLLTYVTYHPASILWGNYQNEKRIIEDLERFRKQKLKAPKNEWPKLDAL